MKKVLSLLLVLVMSFSIALVPVSAASQATEAKQVSVGDIIDTIETTVILIKDTIEQVHNVVGQILAVFGNECVFCEQVHEIIAEA